MAKKHIKFWSLLLALVMVMSLLPMSALAADTTSYSNKETAKTETSVEANKVAVDNGNGTYTVKLSTKGVTETGSETQNLPADVVLVIDTSTSMNYAATKKTCGSTSFTEKSKYYTYYVCDNCGKTYYSKPDSCTNTITDQTRLDVAKAAAKSFVSGLLAGNDQISIGLFDFSGSNRTNIALTKDKSTLNNAIDNLKTPDNGDGTWYEIGLNGASTILKSATAQNKFVVFISDGAPNKGHEGVDAATALKNSGATIFTVGIDASGAETKLKDISSVDANGDAYYYAASSDGTAGNSLKAILTALQKQIETMTYSGKNAVMTDVVNTDDFYVVGTPSGDGVTYSNGTITWDIGVIGSTEKTLSFTVQPKDGKYGTLYTNKNVSLTFDSTKLDNKVTFTKAAIGDPTVEIAQPTHNLTINYVYEDDTTAADKYAEDYKVGDPYSVKSPPITGYTPNTETVTGTMGSKDIAVKVTYTARTDLSYTVNYLEKGTDKVLATAKVENGQTFGEEVTENAIDIEGYNAVDPTTATITIAVTGNVINFYYTARTDLSYTVNYLEKGTDKVLATAKVENGQTFGEEVTENAIDIEGYNAVDPTTATITIAVTGNVINFYYTARTDLSYTVNYLEKGTDKVLATAKVENGQTFGEEVTENAIDIEGYNAVDPTTATITIAVTGNVINFYYTARTDLSYTVNYLEKGTDKVLATAKVENGQTFGEEVTENAIDIEGYNAVDPTTATITIAVTGNVINFYYTARTDLSYTVNYLEKGTDKVLATAKVENGQTFGEEVTENAIDIEGYNAVDPTTATITIAVTGNVINFYYTARTDLSYTVNYLEKGTDKVLATAKVENGQTFGEEVTENAIDIEGYNAVDPTTATITIAVTGNVINFYYTARTDLSYTVNYLEKGTDKVLATAKVENGQTFGEEVTENAIDIEGYNAVDPTTATITIAVTGNVINFYYTARTDLSYTVNYLEKGTDKVLATAKVENGQTFGEEVTENAIDIEGYNAVDPTTATITIAVTGNVINFYYTARTDLSYTVNYLEKGTDKVLATAKVENGQTFGEEVTENAIDIEGYNAVDPTTATITIAVTGNVINFYYTARTDLSYTVNYLEKGTDKVLATAKVENGQTFGEEVTENAIDIEGYNAVDPTTATITIAVTGNVINFYYTARTDLSYTVNYLEKGTDKVLATAKVENGQTFGEEVTENAIDIEGYNAVDPTTATITIAVTGNVINFYYTARTDLSYTVNYLEKGTDKVLATAKVENGQTFGEEVTENAIDIEGYNAVDPTTATITIAVTGNVINFYYTARTDLSYTVNYLEKGTDKVLATAKVENGQTFGEEVTENAIDIEGYNAVDPTTATITIAVTGNVINFYYTARTDLSYTVNYLEKGTDKVLATAKVENGQTFGEEVTENAIDIEGYNAVDPTTATITIAVTGNVINFYYTATVYNITYDLDGGELATGTTNPATYTVKDNFTLNNPTKSGYTFDGWVGTELAQTTKTVTVPTGSTGDRSYTAKWTANPIIIPINPPVDIPDEDVPKDLNSTDHYVYIMGYPDGTVQPNGNITRAEVTTAFYRLLTTETRDSIFTSSKAPYSDIAVSQWFNKAIASMSTGKYVMGYPDGSFGANKNITRAEFVAIAARFMNAKDGTVTFSDVSTTNWAYQYISTAVSYGWIEGYEDGTFRPNQPITRAEAMTIINRMLNRGVDANGLMEGFKDWPDNVKNAWYYFDVLEATNDHEYTGARPVEQWTSLTSSYTYDIVKYERP